MKHQLLFLFAAVTLLFFSCQKEIDWGLGGNASQKLVRIKSKTGTDTTQIDYYYDINKKLIREQTTGIGGGINLNNDLRISRNSSGIIITTVQIASSLVAVGIDSVVTRYNYNAGTSKYTSAVFLLPIPGFTISDSTVYTYDASGRIISDAHYLKVSGLPVPLPAVLGLKNNYTYSSSGSNLAGLQQNASTTPGRPLSPVASQSYTFDTKTNPLIISTEAILLNRTGLYNANNPVKTVVTNTVSPGNDFTMDYMYKYNPAGKPDSSFGTRTPGGAVTASKYFYQ